MMVISLPHESLRLSRLLWPLKAPVQKDVTHGGVDNDEP